MYQYLRTTDDQPICNYYKSVGHVVKYCRRRPLKQPLQEKAPVAFDAMTAKIVFERKAKIYTECNLWCLLVNFAALSPQKDCFQRRGTKVVVSLSKTGAYGGWLAPRITKIWPSCRAKLILARQVFSPN